ncbi:MAG: hypothetical protein ABSE22_10275 [Xanthobacteraceae bacterium]
MRSTAALHDEQKPNSARAPQTSHSAAKDPIERLIAAGNGIGRSSPGARNGHNGLLEIGRSARYGAAAAFCGHPGQDRIK